MISFSYIIQNETGLHARPAGMLVNQAKPFSSQILIEKNGKSAHATSLMKLLGLGITCGDTIQVTIDGTDETAAADAIKRFLEETL